MFWKVTTRFAIFSAVLVVILCATFFQAFAQTLFQNNNQACESEQVLCTSFSGSNGSLFCENDAVSIACRNISGIADFNGDTFPDCVASTTGTANDAEGLIISVLMNKGSPVGCSGAQFNPALDYVLTGLTNSQDVIEVGTVVAGQLDGTGNSDFAAPEVRGAPAPKHVSSVLNYDPSTPDESVITTTDVDWEPTGLTQDGFNFDLFESNASERGMALFDCDNNGTLDAVIGVLEDESASPSPLPFDFRIDILKNSGSGLQAISGPGDSFDTGVAFNDSPSEASLAVGDFDNDGFLDVVMAMQQFSGGSKVSVCLNNGNCGFSCSVQLNLADAHPNDSDPFPSSLAAGDFDGNGTEDIVVTEPQLNSGNEGIHYYFGNGDGTFQTGGTHVVLNQPDQRIPKVLTTGCFNNDNVVDVAVSGDSVPRFDGNVEVVTSNGSGGLNTQIPLRIPPVVSPSPADNTFELAGIDAADFDKQGGDDIIVLGTDDSASNGRFAFIFMNRVETLTAVAGADQSIALNTTVTLSGTRCAASPDDPTDPARFDVLWTLSPTTGAALSGADTLTPTFTATVPGTYLLTLQCRSRCTSIVTGTKQIIVPEIPPPTPVPSSMPFPGTQGDCVADLTPGIGGSKMSSFGILLLLPGFLALWRVRFFNLFRQGR